MARSGAEGGCGAVLLPSWSTVVPDVLLPVELWAIHGCNSGDKPLHKGHLMVLVEWLQPL